MANLVGTTGNTASISAFKLATFTPQWDTNGAWVPPTSAPDGSGAADGSGNYMITVPTVEAYWIVSEWQDGEVRVWQQTSEAGTTNFDPGVPTD